MAAARESRDNPSVGPSRAQPWNRERPTLRQAGGPSWEPWDPEPIVDPVGFHEATVERRLRRFGTAA